MTTAFLSRFPGLSLATALVATFALAGTTSLHAAPLSLSKVPLYVNESVEPNFVLTFDDSGSMLRGFVPDAFSDESTYFPGYPHVDGPDSGTALDPIDTRCWWRDTNWAFSSAVNKIYYNPEITYSPPKKADGSSMPNASFTAAWEDGIQANMGLATARNIPGGSTTRNLETDYRILWELGYSTTYNSAIYRPGIIRYRATNSSTCEPAEGSTADNIGYRKFPTNAAAAFYYNFTGNAAVAGALFNNANYTAVDVRTLTAVQKVNFANWYSYYRTRTLLARTALSRVFDSQQNLRVTWQALTAPILTNNSVINSIANGSSQRTDLFDFIFRNDADGGTPNVPATQRVGTYFGGGTNANNDLNTTNPYYDSVSTTELSCRQNFHLLVTDGSWNHSSGESSVTANVDGTGRTLPDGVAYPNGTHTSIYSRESANSGGFADTAFYYWATDLRSTLANNVPAHYEDLAMGVTGGSAVLGADELPSSKPEIYWNPSNDPATWQHVVQYAVGFGIGGNVPFPGAYDALRRGTYPTGWPNWGAIDDTNEQKVDDTWHAAINSRGEFFSVNDPQELVDSLNTVFLSIGRRTSSNTPISLSSGLLTATTLSYQTLFDTSDWSGRVVANRLATSPPVPEWDASCVLTGGVCPSVPSAGTLPAMTSASRRIATINGTVGVPFQFANLSTAQQALLNINPVTGATDALGSQRLSYVRGDRAREVQNGGTFRNRKSLLGAVVNSLAQRPRDREDYIDDASFEAASAERARPYSVFANTMDNYDTLFFGANDGMLHAVDARNAAQGGGAERWAYVPAAVMKNLNKLTDQSALQFESYVDATPQIRDVFLNGAWKRVLVGGLRLGGQAIYALDVTNPVAANDGAVAAKVLWEFSDRSTGGTNLGFTYGSPFITRLDTGDWVVLVPGGYNSDAGDGVVGDGYARLFVLRLRDGAVLKEFNLGSTSKGLSSVQAGDYRVSGPSPVLSTTDVAFAGDLNGNIWRFNLEGTSSAAWTAEKFFTAPANQSITVLPRLVRTAYDDAGAVRRKYVVTFGTGKYVENADRSTTFQQSYYGLYDQGPGSSDYPLNQSKLLQQTLTTSGTTRRLTTLQVPAAKRGWFFNFLASGERNITQATVRNVTGTLIFSTLAPLSANPCSPAAESYLMFVDASTGGVPGTGEAGVDTNNDGVPDSTDAGQLSAAFDSNLDGRVNSGDNPLVIGIRLAGFLPGVTPISNVGGGGAEILLPPDALPGGGGNAGGTCTVPPCIGISNPEWRRRSWRELLN